MVYIKAWQEWIRRGRPGDYKEFERLFLIEERRGRGDRYIEPSAVPFKRRPMDVNSQIMRQQTIEPVKKPRMPELGDKIDIDLRKVKSRVLEPRATPMPIIPGPKFPIERIIATEQKAHIRVTGVKVPEKTTSKTPPQQANKQTPMPKKTTPTPTSRAPTKKQTTSASAKKAAVRKTPTKSVTRATPKAYARR